MTKNCFLGLLVVLSLVATASNRELFSENQSLVVRSALTSEERRHCALWPYARSVADLAPRGAAPAERLGVLEESHFSELRLPRVVDLNNAGALEVVRRVKPEHYPAVLKILDTVVRNPGADAGSVGAYDFDYPNILLTSMPPQRPLRFTMDETRYEAKIVLTSVCALPALK